MNTLAPMFCIVRDQCSFETREGLETQVACCVPFCESLYISGHQFPSWSHMRVKAKDCFVFSIVCDHVPSSHHLSVSPMPGQWSSGECDLVRVCQNVGRHAT